MLQPFNLDPRVVRQQFDRRAANFEVNDYLLREIERRMFERLDVVKIAPAKILDLGCGLGAGVAELGRRFPQAEVLGVDLSPRMIEGATQRVLPSSASLFSRFMKSMGAGQAPRLKFEVTDLAKLPSDSESVDLLWSNLVFHWMAVPEPSLQELYRVAKPGALLMFSAFGVDTLQEIRPKVGKPKRNLITAPGFASDESTSASAETAPIDLMRFRDMHDWGDALVEVGFAEPVMDMERITLSFSEPKNLLKDLHSLGGNALAGRRATLSPTSLPFDLIRKLTEKAGESAQLALTFEVVYGHAWVPAKKKRADGLTTIDFLPKKPKPR
jgi:malonyl-CoA O-methyltransferase